MTTVVLAGHGMRSCVVSACWTWFAPIHMLYWSCSVLPDGLMVMVPVDAATIIFLPSAWVPSWASWMAEVTRMARIRLLSAIWFQDFHV